MAETGETVMSKDISLAFQHPDARAAAMAESPPRDRISLRDHIVEVEIGAFQSERGTTQRVQFNIVVEVSAHQEPLDDDVDRILSYDTIAEAIAHELADERLNLLETLAERVAERILHEPQAYRAFVRIEKLDRGPGALGVEIVRTRPKDLAAVDDMDEDTPHPVVVYLPNSGVDGDKISALLDQLEDQHAPLILCVGPGEGSAPRSRALAAQRRIDLLAIEQNAWVLAGLDRRCVVVSTRTELDWAMKNGRISVWAPSKIVLDSVDGPSAEPDETLPLIVWFAELMDARKLIVFGGDMPKSETIVVEQRSLTGR